MITDFISSIDQCLITILNSFNLRDSITTENVPKWSQTDDGFYD